MGGEQEHEFDLPYAVGFTQNKYMIIRFRTHIVCTLSWLNPTDPLAESAKAKVSKSLVLFSFLDTQVCYLFKLLQIFVILPFIVFV